MLRRVILLATVVAGWLLISTASANAAIIFCNKFPHEVWIAIAYPQDNGAWMTRGWLSLDTGQCAPFDTAIHVKEFWYHGMSVPYRDASGKSIRMEWGKTRKFAIWESDNFQYWDAQNRVLKSTLAYFTQGASSSSGDVSATVTFTTGGSTVSFR